MTPENEQESFRKNSGTAPPRARGRRRAEQGREQGRDLSNSPSIHTSNNAPRETPTMDGWPNSDGDMLEAAWGIIANAGGWDNELSASPGWREAAERWRDRYHDWLHRNGYGTAITLADAIDGNNTERIVPLEHPSRPEMVHITTYPVPEAITTGREVQALCGHRWTGIRLPQPGESVCADCVTELIRRTNATEHPSTVSTPIDRETSPETRLIDRMCRCGTSAAWLERSCAWHDSVSAKYAADLLDEVTRLRAEAAEASSEIYALMTQRDDAQVLGDRFRDEINSILRGAGIYYPLGHNGIRDLVNQRDGQRARAEDAEAERDRLRDWPDPALAREFAGLAGLVRSQAASIAALAKVGEAALEALNASPSVPALEAAVEPGGYAHQPDEPELVYRPLRATELDPAGLVGSRIPVRVYSASSDRALLAEGTVIAYLPRESIEVEETSGQRRAWLTSLPIEIGLPDPLHAWQQHEDREKR